MIPRQQALAGRVFRAGRSVGESLVFVLVAIYIEALIRTVNISRLAARLGVPVAADEDDFLADPSPLPRWAARRCRSVHRVMRFWPFAAERECLRESLLLGFALRRLQPRLQIGVRTDSSSIVAHAWVECRGHVLDPMASRYTKLTGREMG